MKKFFRTGIITALLVMMASGGAYASSILFHYINSNPGNLSTIVNVINTATDVTMPCAFPNEMTLHYRYMTKPIEGTGSAAIDVCQERNFSRPTTPDDLVTFDVAGDINGGDAMFNDLTDYNAGAGAPSFDLPNFGFTDPRRGYLLVTHQCGGAEIPLESTDAAVGVGNGQLEREDMELDGETMLLDVVNGAAWGYRAEQTYATFTGAYSFAGITGGRNPVVGATTEQLGENDFLVGNGPIWEKAVLYPPDEFRTRFCVTPLVISTDVITTNDMSLTAATAQKRTRIALRDATGVIGVTDRDGNPVSGGAPVHVRCVAGIDLDTLTGGGMGAWFDDEGGWAFVDLMDPIALTDPPENEVAVTVAADHPAVVTKVQFGASSSFSTGMINSGENIRGSRTR
jgi:hypothetical protein